MSSGTPPARARTLGSFAAILVVAGAGVGAFAYAAGWLTPDRLTPARMLAALDGPKGPALGHRRNHAKGICFTGIFAASGEGREITRASVLASGQYPVVGRFNLGTTEPDSPDATVRVRGMGLQITAPDGAVWRMAMIDPPFFPVATPRAFYDLQVASHSTERGAMPAFIAQHPEFRAFAEWAGSAPWTGSYAETGFNSLDSFVFTDTQGYDHPVRWSLLPDATVTALTQAQLAAMGPDHLEQEIRARVAAAPQSWRMVVTLADPIDQTADPSKAWPEDRRRMEVGTLIVQRIEAERDGPCRDINFDPTVLPDGMSVSDDPFPAARSAAYARSYNLRAAEVRDYPYQRAAATEASR
ncbi:catalase family peroxidase [Roseomonas sp. HJA6]|uniref:Catalase-related peroxidase n=1 Tax=Roseomonas alba TaxID=2846776 RepID=A0ABS7ADW3_9PROT|nr:catalase family peroxidase [Neoroseomonas alba]MBW6400498.1 catalase family peroxidase [Neoroseomonas alba]